MTLKYFEGFEQGEFAPNISGSMAVNGTSPRSGSYRAGGYNTPNIIFSDVNDTATEIWVGAALMVNDSQPGTSLRRPHLRVRSNGTIIASIDIGDGPGPNQVVVRDVTTNLETIAFPWPVNTWIYVEMRVKSAPAGSGEIEIWHNGTQIYLNTTATTQSGGAPNILNEIYAEAGNNSELWFDDVYVVAVDGSGETGRLGGPRVLPLAPTADGTYTEWTALNGGAHSAEVDETPDDGDTTYVSSDLLNAKDSFVLADLPATADEVYGVRVDTTARKEVGDARSLSPFLRVGSVDYSADEQALAETFVTFFDIFDVNPATSANFTPAELNGAEVGAEVTA